MPIKTVDATGTRHVGEVLAGQLREGDVLLLFGQMGAGKSELARGIARGLGVAGPIPSPTYTILNRYAQARIPLHHFDWYRVEDSSELMESGLDEWIGQGITVIEWPERAPQLWPMDRLDITITVLSTGERSITLQRQGEFRVIEPEDLS